MRIFLRVQEDEANEHIRKIHLLHSILWQGGVVQQWKMTSKTSLKSSMYKQGKEPGFCRRRCNTYAKSMTQ